MGSYAASFLSLSMQTAKPRPKITIQLLQLKLLIFFEPQDHKVMDKLRDFLGHSDDRILLFLPWLCRDSLFYYLSGLSITHCLKLNVNAQGKIAVFVGNRLVSQMS